MAVVTFGWRLLGRRPGLLKVAIIHFRTKSSLLTDTLTGIIVEFKRLLAQDFTITILTGTKELRFLKRGCLYDQTTQQSIATSADR